ncbi:hypothetical protein QL285_010119 [Trifolium repens]|nr:hypothetical protein QL285_010119 [Trifolium repens]
MGFGVTERDGAFLVAKQPPPTSAAEFGEPNNAFPVTNRLHKRFCAPLPFLHATPKSAHELLSATVFSGSHCKTPSATFRGVFQPFGNFPAIFSLSSSCFSFPTVVKFQSFCVKMF